MLANDEAIQEFNGRLLHGALISNENVQSEIELQNSNSMFDGCWMTGSPKMQNGQFIIEPSTIECNDKKFTYTFNVEKRAVVLDCDKNTTSLKFTHDEPSKNAIASYNEAISNCAKMPLLNCNSLYPIPVGRDYIKNGSVVKVVILNNPILISKKPRLTSIQDIH